MPPVIVIAAAAVGVYVGLKWLQRETKRAQDKAAQTTQAPAKGGPVDGGTLELDEITGVYRPKRSQDR